MYSRSFIDSRNVNFLKEANLLKYDFNNNKNNNNNNNMLYICSIFAVFFLYSLVDGVNPEELQDEDDMRMTAFGELFADPTKMRVNLFVGLYLKNYMNRSSLHTDAISQGRILSLLAGETRRFFS